MHDVLIAGAGPAGAIAATILARAGARVLLVDRSRFPRPKLCGDTLNPGAFGLLRRLGLDCAAHGALPLDGMLVTGPGNVRVTGRYGDARGYAISRSRLDDALLMAAGRAGARIEQEVLVDSPLIDTAGDALVTGAVVKGRAGMTLRLRARLTIAADGRYSRLARALRLSRSARRPRRWAIGSYFQDVDGMDSLGEMHVRDGHYIGVAPLPGSIVNACVVTPTPRPGPPGDILTSALAADPLLRGRFARARMIGIPVCLGPLAVECAAPGMPGLLLAGDSAGFIDPMTGDGLRFAIRGAELAAAEALHALEHGNADAHLRLQHARRREFRAKWRFNRTMRWVVDDARTLRVARIGAGVAPQMVRHLIRYAGDLHAA
jgi:flavin-dependent dehydrogenase